MKPIDEMPLNLQQNNFQTSKRKCDFKLVYSKKQFDEIGANYLFSISQNGEVIFLAYSDDKLQCEKYCFFKFYQLSQNKLYCQTFNSPVDRGFIKGCLFLKDSKRSIICWENGTMEFWQSQRNKWHYNNIFYESQVFSWVKQIIINHAENLIILPCRFGLTLFWKRNNQDNQFQGNLFENEDKKFDLDCLSFNETDKFLIGYKIDNDQFQASIVILQQLSKFDWVTRRKIIVYKVYYSGIIKNYFFMENQINFKNYIISWNKWSGKLIKKKRFCNDVCMVICNIKSKTLIHLGNKKLHIFSLKNNELIRQHVINFNEQLWQKKKYINFDNEKLLLFYFGQSLCIYKNVQ